MRQERTLRKIRLLRDRIKITVKLRSSGDWLAWIGHNERLFQYPEAYAFGDTEEYAIWNLIGKHNRSLAHVKRITWRPIRTGEHLLWNKYPRTKERICPNR